MALVVFLRGVNVGGHMKTIGFLDRIDDLFGVPATTRSWTTIAAIVRILKGQVREGR